jgi:hypothetical protein
MSGWHLIGSTDVATGLAWGDPGSQLLFRCDPYLIWADLNAQLQSPDEDKLPNLISVLVEVDADFDWAHEKDLSASQRQWLEMRRTDASTIVPCVLRNTSQLIRLVYRVVRRGDHVLRFTLCRPRADVIWTAIEEQLEPLLRSGPLPAPSPAKQSCIVAIIDDGCAFLSERLAQGGQTRQISLLDQDRLAGQIDNYWKPPPIAWQGLQLDSTSINQLRALGPNELNGYRAAGVVDPQPAWTHGQVVVDLSVGWPDPFVDPGAAPCAGEAPRDFIFVQLPRATVEDTSGASLDSYALDAMLYSALMAEVASPGANVVANLSYGVYARGHDGTSPFEQKTFDFLNGPVATNLQLVLPAGNSHDLRTHAARTLPDAKGGQSTCLCWHIPADCTNDNTLQIWLPLGSQVLVELRPPGADAFLQLPSNSAYVWEENGEVRCAAVSAPSVAYSTMQTMVFLAVSPTRKMTTALMTSGVLGGNTLPTIGWAPPGDWVIKITNQGQQSLHFDARIERSDPPPGSGDRTQPPGRRQSYFVERERDAETPKCTLNGIATIVHPHLHVIGAMQRIDERLSTYSSAGPFTKPAYGGLQPVNRGPTKVTIGDRSRHRPGLHAAGWLSRSIVHVDGTSVAAATFSRILARELCGGPGPKPATKPANPKPHIEEPEKPLEAPPALRGSNDRVLPC